MDRAWTFASRGLSPRELPAAPSVAKLKELFDRFNEKCEE
jgi:hypothetical protein